ncbi:TetR/AcrR family transcriptional regulator [Streptococcus dentasini]
MKQEEKSLRTKELILKTALPLFAKQGYQTTTMADIIKSAGLSKGAVYHHFASKEAILQEIMKAEVAEVTQYLSKLCADKDISASQRLSHLVDFLLQKDSLQDMSHINWAEKVPFGLLFTLRNTIQVLVPYVSDMIQQGNQQGEFDCTYPVETASVFLILADIWFDPVLAGADYSFSSKIDYLSHWLELSGVPILSPQKRQQIKKRMADIYEKKGKSDE